MELKAIIALSLTFSIFHLGELKNVVQNQDSDEEFDITTTTPKHVVATPYKGNTLNVTWDFSNNYNLKNVTFILKYWKRDDDTGNFFSKTYIREYFRDPHVWALLMGLQPDTYYYVKICTSTNNTFGEPESEPALGHTYRRAPRTSPTSVRISDVDNSTLKVTWHPNLISLDEEPIDGYKIRLWQHDQIRSAVRDVIVPSDKLEGYVHNLVQRQIYELRVLAFSKAGDGIMSTPPYVFSLRP